MFVSVAVPVPTLGVLTYRVPPGLTAPPPGARVRVPLGKRVVTGCVTAVFDDPPVNIDGENVREVAQIVDEEPFVPRDVLALALWVADYYLSGAGDAVAVVMPPFARSAGGKGFKTIRVARLTAQGEDVARDAGSLVTFGAKQREALELLASAPGGLTSPSLVQRGIPLATLTGLSSKGLITIGRTRVDRDPFDGSTLRLDDAHGTTTGNVSARPYALTPEQTAALARLEHFSREDKFKVAVLHGVTGSGKTELYLRLARSVIDGGRRVLVLVPEIALTPAAAGTFRAAFGDRVAIQHSGLSDGERHDQWHRIRRDQIDVVVGTRSAVFAPIASLGLIVVDEEHDGSYKQQESPRYHGRDVAIVRAREAGALVVLGSATPSMESYHNALSGRYERVTLTKRILDRPMASVRVIDMREQYALHGPDLIISDPLRIALAERLSRREQAVVLLNRRGYAVVVFCRQCGATAECPNCTVSLTVHLKARRARCHYCNYSMPLPKACLVCAGPYLEQMGYGTERVEDEIRHLFPEARVARVDRDTIRRRGAIVQVLAKFARQELDVLVGTQMIAKGHDFPRVTLVGVVSADVGLGVADFRAAERTFQLLTQVAGRAGRGSDPGEALVQTLYPRHYSILHACRQDYPAFYDEEIRYRRSMRYPPTVALINAIVRGKTSHAALDEAADLADKLREIEMSGSLSGPASFAVLGPAPAPLMRLKGEHRAQIFLKGTKRAAMRDAFRAALEACPDMKRRIIIDVDPLSVL